jgi:hemerythrin-like domain-containing protein
MAEMLSDDNVLAMSDLDPHAGPIRFFTADHRRCDAVWARLEAAADTSDAAALRAVFAEFDAAMRQHLDLEEKVLFPAFEAATGMRGGPTQVMRMEHAQMRQLLDRMAKSAAAGDADGVVDQGDTLLMLVQQHNLKEEGMLYPMCERALSGGAWEPVAGELAASFRA